ncbi:MAG: hypothetical protein V4658_05540 [Bacteroidota bacterium]
MKKLLFGLLIAATISGCNNTTSKKHGNGENTTPSLPALSDKEKSFIMDFTRQQGKAVYIVTTTRNRYFTRKDGSQIHGYFTKAEHPEYINEFTFERGDERRIDTNGVHAGITWVDDNDIHTCRTVLRDLWPCFKNKYGGAEFYYFSIPLFSKDDKYALMSINFSSADKTKSRGGTSLFKKEKGKWEEVAILTNWGAEPE